MGSEKNNQFRKRKIDKRFLSKNKTIKLYKEKAKKIDLFKKEVEEITQLYEQVDVENVEKFDDLPLSSRTKRGLKQCGYFVPTDIQKETILLSLKERDILGAAKTGSGKTLAFVIPLLERLYVSGWTILDGLGALIITPTRELAYQIYEVINKVGKYHQFSVGLIIGGKDLAKERNLLDKCNIMICTPGRLLQHMDENPLFDAMNLKLLILDEADRILDLGFEKTMNAILDNLHQERQTLLFSATQTKSVKDLARLSLKNPVYVSVDEHAKFTTPESLRQSYIVCEAHDKMNLLWSFIKSHKKQKILVFMASCKQVKFTFESFCRLRPGVSIMALYGSLHQLRRMQIYDDFCKKNHVVMFATDIASRGLDFPDVSWVVQLDCPEDVNTYIHRAGRTARYKKGGESLLVLLPSEKDSMVKQLTERKIPIEEIKANPNKLFDVKRKLEAILMRDSELKESGVRGFKSYLKSIFLMKDKSIFDVTKIDTNRYANSLGLNYVPRIRFLEKHVLGFKNNSNQDPQSGENQISADEKTDINEEAQKNLNSVLKNSMLNCDGDISWKDDLLMKTEKSLLILSDVEEDEEEDALTKSTKVLTKAAAVKKALKKKSKLNTIIKFDEDGNPLREVGGHLVPDSTAGLRLKLLEDNFTVDNTKMLLDKENELDKELFKEKIKAKHKKERLKIKEKRWLKNPAGVPPTLNDPDNTIDEDDDQSVVDPNNISSSSEDNSEDEEQSSDEANVDRSEEAEDSDLSHYNEETSSIANSSNEEEEQNSFKNSGNQSKQSTGKRKNQFGSEEIQKGKKIKIDRSLEDDEQLALHFLNGI